MDENRFATIEESLKELRAGRAVIVVDDEHRENEGDLIVAADRTTPDVVNFLATHGRGLICVAMERDRLHALSLDQMVVDNTAKLGTKFTVSVDAVADTTTGISAHDRAGTIQVLTSPKTKPEDLARPGHIFPIEAQAGGVLARPGHTEAAVDLMKLAGLTPVGVLCEIMDDDGSMMRGERLFAFAHKHDLKVITIHELIEYRHRTEKLVEKITEVELPTRWGEFRLHLYKSQIDHEHHLALVKGNVKGSSNVLVRVHSSCLTGDVLGSCRCDCGGQLHAAMKMVESEGLGIVLYMRQEGRGIGLGNKIRAYKLQDEGRDTVEANHDLGFQADLRDYASAAQMLRDLGPRSIRLLTNNPKKVVGLQTAGLDIVERLPLEIKPNQYSARYLETKRDKLGHLLHLKEG